MELENESIKKLYHWMNIEEFEKCGRLLMNKGLYSIDFSNVNKGFVEQYDTGQRLGCTFPSPRGNIFFHTHPKKSKSYPSFEDIITVAKLSYKEDIEPISIIGTFWGIWYIRKQYYHYLLNKKDTENFKDDYVRYTKSLYKLKNKIYDMDVKTYIDEFCRNINEMLEDYCQISFINWASEENTDFAFLIKKLSTKKKSIKKTLKKKSLKTKSIKSMKHHCWNMNLLLRIQ